jgi:hypothetical protein
MLNWRSANVELARNKHQPALTMHQLARSKRHLPFNKTK